MANYYNPRVMDTGWGQGLERGMGNFANMFLAGAQARQQRQENQLNRDWQTQMLERREQRDIDMMKRRWDREDQKELISKREEAEFAAAAWDAIASQVPGFITPEMDERFHSGSMTAKRGRLVQMQALLAQELKRREEQRRFEQAQRTATLMQPDGSPSPSYFMTGNGQLVPYPKPEPPKPKPGYVDFGDGRGYYQGVNGEPLREEFLWETFPGPTQDGEPLRAPLANAAPSGPGGQRPLRSYKMADGSVAWFDPMTGEQVSATPSPAASSGGAAGTPSAPASLLQWKPR